MTTLTRRLATSSQVQTEPDPFSAITADDRERQQPREQQRVEADVEPVRDGRIRPRTRQLVHRLRNIAEQIDKRAQRKQTPCPWMRHAVRAILGRSLPDVPTENILRAS